MGCERNTDFSANSCSSIFSSGCISWQGQKFEDLNVCIGDSLTYVVNIVLTKIKDLLKGKGIILDDLSLQDCDYLDDLLDGEEKNLINILKIYKTAICELKAATELNAQNISSFTNVALYTLGCISNLDPCGDALTFQQLIQAIITKLCALQTSINNIATTIEDVIEEGVGNALLGGVIKSCGNNGITFAGTGNSAVVTFQALVPPYAPILYTGSLAFFDGMGIGLPNTALCGWYLCNGLNGTPNSTALPQNISNTLKYIIRFN
jgi:hypothetical protein